MNNDTIPLRDVLRAHDLGDAMDRLIEKRKSRSTHVKQEKK